MTALASLLLLRLGGRGKMMENRRKMEGKWKEDGRKMEGRWKDTGEREKEWGEGGTVCISVLLSTNSTHERKQRITKCTTSTHPPTHLSIHPPIHPSLLLLLLLPGLPPPPRPHTSSPHPWACWRTLAAGTQWTCSRLHPSIRRSHPG